MSSRPTSVISSLDAVSQERWPCSVPNGVLFGMRVSGASLPCILAIVALLVASQSVWSHCDSLDGPVVTDARAALESGKLVGALKWIPEESESEVREAFNQARAVRELGPEARELADRYFFETLVRLHRASEGAPFTGLKPAGSPVHRAISRADDALAKGDVDRLAKDLAHAVETSVRTMFSETIEAKSGSDESVAAGREYVHRYVNFVHYIKYLHDAITGDHSHGHATTGD